MACLSSYIEKIAVRCGLTETRVYKTPMEPGFVKYSGAVSWKSGLQAIVTLSSCKAEYVAFCAEVCEVLYLRNLLHEMSFA